MKRLLSVIPLVLILTACGTTTTQVETNTQINVQYNTDNIRQSINKLITSGECDSNFIESFEFDLNDMITEVKVNQDYFFDGAYYMQTEMCMYRFQLNEKGLIESYIKYGLED